MERTVVRVYHGSYGCETGCCGHIVEWSDGTEEFQFSHPYGDSPLEFAKRLITEEYGEEHVRDLNWDKVELEVSNS